MEKLEKLEIPTIEFAKVTLLATGGNSSCGDGVQTYPTTGEQGNYVECDGDTTGSGWTGD